MLYPNAQLKASSLDAFVAAVEPYTSQLPVITAEFGDSWIYVRTCSILSAEHHTQSM
jgi:hypothetical protein